MHASSNVTRVEPRTRTASRKDAGVFPTIAGQFHATPIDLARTAGKASMYALGATHPGNVHRTTLLAVDGTDLMSHGAFHIQGSTAPGATQKLPLPFLVTERANPLCLGGPTIETAPPCLPSVQRLTPEVTMGRLAFFDVTEIKRFIFLNTFLYYTSRKEVTMATPARSAPQAKSPTAHVLLQHFPRHVHWAMKGEAARRGIVVSAVYAEACRVFLDGLAKARRTKP